MGNISTLCHITETCVYFFGSSRLSLSMIRPGTVHSINVRPMFFSILVHSVLSGVRSIPHLCDISYIFLFVESLGLVPQFLVTYSKYWDHSVIFDDFLHVEWDIYCLNKFPFALYFKFSIFSLLSCVFSDVLLSSSDFLLHVESMLEFVIYLSCRVAVSIMLLKCCFQSFLSSFCFQHKAKSTLYSLFLLSIKQYF